MTSRPSRRARIAVAGFTAVAAAVVALIKARQWGYPADFAFFWLAAKSLLAHGDPYTSIRPGMAGFYFDNWFVYPLPAAIVVVPLTLFALTPAAMIFSGLSMGVLAYALTRDNWQRWPILMSFPALWAVGSGQWSPLITAAALTPAFGWVAACKPTLGVAAFLHRPSRRFVLLAAALTAVSFIAMVDWPVRWLAAVQRSPAGNYQAPLLQPGGFLLLLAALRWRRPDARLLLGMACVPQSMLVYDQLPLGLLARTRIQAYVFSLWSYLVPFAARFVGAGPTATSKVQTLEHLAHMVTWAMYLPLLVIVLRRPNVAEEALAAPAEAGPSDIRLDDPPSTATPQSVQGS